jgi:clan AA aspartic protease
MKTNLNSHMCNGYTLTLAGEASIILGMGLTKVLLKIKNVYDPSKEIEEKFLVDSGAIYTVVPGDKLKKIGIKPSREESFSLADGTDVIRKIGYVLYEFEGNIAPAPVIFGEKGDSLLLGAVTLESLGLVLDPFQRKILKAHLRM